MSVTRRPLRRVVSHCSRLPNDASSSILLLASRGHYCGKDTDLGDLEFSWTTACFQDGIRPCFRAMEAELADPYSTLMISSLVFRRSCSPPRASREADSRREGSQIINGYKL
ncbi:hypothetical protein Bca52824_095348 [Brassica carinata]|uniref:Uncharacterized protein n=1 Tax=Brassica carinata TaxID=52824 RepID=A0A8X7NZ29_BRACI|nr:hypothetical protein Bca52824_095348 [Brassica carinata]